jgi:hypothetical protein
MIMDMSKLPRLSQSPRPPDAADEPTAPAAPAAPPPATAAAPTYAAHDAVGSLAEAWISLAIGALLLFFVPYTLQYASSKLFGTSFVPFADPTRPFPARCDFIMYNDGTKIFYRDLPNYWSDMAVTAFAIVLILDGLILLLARRRGFVAVAFVFTLLATAGNLVWLIGSYSQYGFAMLSALAVIFGVYIALYQWKLLGLTRPLPRDNRPVAA